MKPLAVLFAVGFLFGSCAKKEDNPVTPSNTPTVDTSRVKTSTGGRYLVSLTAPDTVMLYDTTLTFKMTVKMSSDTSQVVDSLTPIATFTHAVMGHDGCEVPYVVENGAGVYTIFDICAGSLMGVMTGRWDLRIVLGSPPPDTVYFWVEAK